jgi:hypothetical protein
MLRLVAGAGSLLCAWGCGPRLDPKDLGKPVFEIPVLPGSEAPYPLPRLDEPAAATGADPPGPVAASPPSAQPNVTAPMSADAENQPIAPARAPGPTSAGETPASVVGPDRP